MKANGTSYNILLQLNDVTKEISVIIESKDVQFKKKRLVKDLMELFIKEYIIMKLLQ